MTKKLTSLQVLARVTLWILGLWLIAIFLLIIFIFLMGLLSCFEPFDGCFLVTRMCVALNISCRVTPVAPCSTSNLVELLCFQNWAYRDMVSGKVGKNQPSLLKIFNLHFSDAYLREYPTLFNLTMDPNKIVIFWSQQPPTHTALWLPSKLTWQRKMNRIYSIDWFCSFKFKQGPSFIASFFGVQICSFQGFVLGSTWGAAIIINVVTPSHIKWC